MSAVHFQDWEPVVFRKKMDPKSKTDVKEAIRKGMPVETQKREGDVKASAAKKRELEKDLYVDPTTEAPSQKALPKLSPEDRQIMIKARTEKKLTQVQLAQQMNVRANVIQDMETGKVLENPSQLQQVNRILGTKLRVQK
jgi:ribosome-binding protein aMBF1 (putative translation factor)